MLSIKYIRENIKEVQDSLLKRQSTFDVDQLLDFDVKRREYLKEVENLRAKRNMVTSEIAELKKNGNDASKQIESMKIVSDNIKNIENNLNKIEQKIANDIYYIPNLVNSSVPDGKNEVNNIVIKEWGNKPTFNFTLRDHVEIGQLLELFDFKRAGKISGSSFPMYTGAGAQLERSLINFMLDFHVENHGYQELFPSFLANRQSMQNTGQLPKFENDMYSIDGDDLFCIPTAEVPITNYHQGEVISSDLLPYKYMAYSACFRREAGSYGKDTKGLSRLHQFNKVELVKFAHPEKSYEELELLVKDAEAILQALGLHYRIIELCSGDLSFSAAKCYDLEVWSPADEKYLEVSSCSNFEDFQARRGNIRFRNNLTGKQELIHTLNGSGVATPRLMIALLETYQKKDGSVELPSVLHPYIKKEIIPLAI